MNYQTVLNELFAGTGVTFNGEQLCDPQVHDERTYARMVKQANLGAGESYMDGWWDCKQLDEFLYRVLRAGIREQVGRSWQMILRQLPAVLFNLQSRPRAFQIGERHYDTGNDLFEAMLDKRMVYSCAYWDGATTLDVAQEAKLELICRKLCLKPGMKVLDIGCGWGSLAQHAAEKYEVSVTGISVSKEQVALAHERCKGLPVSFELQDYRAVKGTFDRIVSVGMFEHVGRRNYRAFMSKVHSMLAQDGLFLLHTIGMNQQGPGGDAWVQKYIFPNSELPSELRIDHAIEGLFVKEHWQNIGVHYDKTLMAWHANFLKNWPRLSARYDERFKRMWEYYLLSFAAMFRARHAQVWQIVYSKQGIPGGYRMAQ